MTIMPTKRLSHRFFIRDTHVVARELLGKLLCRNTPRGKIVGRIAEVECYIGENDLACHASRGRTPRTSIMFGEAGHAYIYLIYGVYHCLNIVTDKIGKPAAVLIRSIEPVSGLEAMQLARRTKVLNRLTTGPGKLTQAMGITRRLNGENIVSSSELWIEHDGLKIASNEIDVSPRVGVDYAGPCALWPWRYYLRHSEFVSKTPHSK